MKPRYSDNFMDKVYRFLTFILIYLLLHGEFIFDVILYFLLNLPAVTDFLFQ